ncbi:hypothetical protein AAFF_G00069870 [Aldrovandia affinis]|uniref:Uncharacterized protein n=1 Tax=Aldrovandia affinis TaxID=143900 RepID=A0AAD7VXQ4_9TELE|nr:hypothetical protein AAFF_G00069870 [Aldrovandia affinis]
MRPDRSSLESSHHSVRVTYSAGRAHGGLVFAVSQSLGAAPKASSVGAIRSFGVVRSTLDDPMGRLTAAPVKSRRRFDAWSSRRFASTERVVAVYCFFLSSLEDDRRT